MKWINYFIKGISFLFMYVGIAGLIAYLWTVMNFGSIEWEQVLLNLAQPMNGVAIDLIIIGILLNIGFSLLVAVFVAKILKKVFFKYTPIGYILMGFVCLVYPIYRWHLVDFVLSQIKTGTIYEEEHHLPKLTANGRNLIVIVLESYEKSYQNEKVLGQNLSPNLTQIQSENISFSGFQQVRQAGWTITSLMSSFCGVPLKLNKMFVNLSVYKTFIPGLSCWPEQLVEQGYETVMMKAAAIQFTATDRFALQHGFKKAVGYRELKADYEKDTISRWGLDDRSFYRAVQDELMRLSSLNKPFLLATVQADTHQPKGHLNKTCQAYFNDYRDAVLCSDKEVMELIRWIQQQPFYPQTTIVVMGDHLLFASNIDSLLAKIPNREIYFTIINPALQQQPVAHTYSNFDVGPTILDAAGMHFDGRYGLGRSLFRADKTLIEKKGKKLEQELSYFSEKYHSWGNDLPLSFFDDPKELEKIPLNETIAFEKGINRFFAAQYIDEMVTDQYWLFERKGFLKVHLDTAVDKEFNLTVRLVVPKNNDGIRIRFFAGSKELLNQVYEKHTLATEKMRIPGSIVNDGILDLRVEITDASETKELDKNIGIQFVSMRFDEVVK